MKRTLGFALFSLVVGIATGMIASTNPNVSTMAATALGLGAGTLFFFATLISHI